LHRRFGPLCSIFICRLKDLIPRGLNCFSSTFRTTLFHLHRSFKRPDSPRSEFFTSTFRITLFHLHRSFKRPDSPRSEFLRRRFGPPCSIFICRFKDLIPRGLNCFSSMFRTTLFHLHRSFKRPDSPRSEFFCIDVSDHFVPSS